MDKVVSLLKKPVTWTAVLTVVLGVVLEPSHVATVVSAVGTLVLAAREVMKKVAWTAN